MKYNVYALVAASLFVGFGLNGSEPENTEAKKEKIVEEKTQEQENKRTWGKFAREKYTSAKNGTTKFVKEVVSPTPEKKTLKKGAVVNPTTGEELILSNRGNGLADGTGYKIDINDHELLDNNQFPHLAKVTESVEATKQPGFVTKERAQAAVGIGMIVAAIYFKDEINSGISYAVKGTRNQVGRAAGWVASWFTSSPKQDEQTETEQN